MIDWRAHGACKDVPIDVFYPTDTTDAFDAHAHAASICATCAVLLDCRQHAIAHEQHGYWGGTTERERIRIRRRSGIHLTTVDPVTDDDTWKRERAVRLWRQGWPMGDIAVELRTYREQINRWLHTAGIDAVPPPMDPGRDDGGGMKTGTG